jgi:hypothetical protein
MRPQALFFLTIGFGLLLPLLAGCGGSTDQSNKPGSAHSSDANKESVPKPPKPDPG